VGKMSDLKSVLKADPTDWLLEKDNPSVRYFTLTDILEKSENDPEVKEAFQVDIEQKGKPSKWVTLNALRVLKRIYG